MNYSEVTYGTRSDRGPTAPSVDEYRSVSIVGARTTREITGNAGGPSDIMTANTPNILGRTKPSATLASRPDVRQVTNRVFGGGMHPQEAGVVKAIDDRAAAYGAVHGDNRVGFTSHQYFAQKDIVAPIFSVNPGELIPQDTAGVGAGGASRAKTWRLNNMRMMDEDMSTQVVFIDGTLDPRTRQEFEQYAPPDGYNTGELQNNIKVRSSLQSRWNNEISEVWATGYHLLPRVHEETPIAPAPVGPPDAFVRVIPRVDARVMAVPDAPLPAAAFESVAGRVL